MIRLFKDDMALQLGQAELSIWTSRNYAAPKFDMNHKDKIDIELSGYKITLFKLRLEKKVSDHLAVLQRFAFRIFIDKSNDFAERIQLQLRLKTDEIFDKSGPCTGEGLDAIEFPGSEYRVVFGTEDGDTFNHRAENSDWLPKRFADRIGWDTGKKADAESFTRYSKVGFNTKIPKLFKNERFYVHYIVAEAAMPDEAQAAWLAVDITKQNLDLVQQASSEATYGT